MLLAGSSGTVLPLFTGAAPAGTSGCMHWYSVERGCPPRGGGGDPSVLAAN